MWKRHWQGADIPKEETVSHQREACTAGRGKLGKVSDVLDQALPFQTCTPNP